MLEPAYLSDPRVPLCESGRRVGPLRHHRCMTDRLPPLDPDAGPVRRTWDAGDHILVEVQTAGEALDQHARLVERGSAPRCRLLRGRT